MNCQYSGRQDTVGDILIDNLKSDVFKNGFLKTFCNTIKIVEHTARFLGKRIITMMHKLRKMIEKTDRNTERYYKT